MSPASDHDNRSVVRVYVSDEQKQDWDEDASALDMSQSEFVRFMVQASRRDWVSSPRGGESDSPSQTDGRNLERQVLETLTESDYRDWDELIQKLTGNIEDRLESTLDRLQRDGKVIHSGRHGGYTLSSIDE